MLADGGQERSCSMQPNSVGPTSILVLARAVKMMCGGYLSTPSGFAGGTPCGRALRALWGGVWREKNDVIRVVLVLHCARRKTKGALRLRRTCARVRAGGELRAPIRHTEAEGVPRAPSGDESPDAQQAPRCAPVVFLTVYHAVAVTRTLRGRSRERPCRRRGSRR